MLLSTQVYGGERYYHGEWEAIQSVHIQFFSYLYIKIDNGNNGVVAHSMMLGKDVADFISPIPESDLSIHENRVVVGPLEHQEAKGIEYTIEIFDRADKNTIVNVVVNGEKAGRYEYDRINADRFENYIDSLQSIRKGVRVKR